MDLNLSNIKKYLSTEDRKRVAEKHGVSTDYISKILRKERNNIKIVEDLIIIANENKDKLEKLESISKNL